jgi:hypothetical protein
MGEATLVPVHTSVNIDGRLTIFKQFSDQLTWIASKADVSAWLFVIEPGRYRLLSDEQVQSDPQLDLVRGLLLEGKPSSAAVPSHLQPLREAAVVARLLPITLAEHKGSWRFPFPKELEAVGPIGGNHKDVSILFSSEGYVEIWNTDVLRSALLPSWHK